MARLRRWLGWTLFAALLFGVGAMLYAVIPPQPRVRIDGAWGMANSNNGTLYTLEVNRKENRFEGPLRAWDTHTGRLLRTMCPDLKEDHNARLAFSPDRSWLVNALFDQGTARIVDLGNGREHVIDLNAIAKL